MDIEFRPIYHWPGTMAARRKRAQFRASYTDTLKLLREELRRLAARDVAIQLALGPRDIRADGLPRADARAPSHPGVILSFGSRHGPLSYPCDTYDDWRDNLRAIALALEHLRAVDRYGVTRRGEQYRGWAALPAPDRGPTTPQAAAVLLAQLTGTSSSSILSSRQICDQAYRAAALVSHPDRGGSTEGFQRVNLAMDVLRRHFGC